MPGWIWEKEITHFSQSHCVVDYFPQNQLDFATGNGVAKMSSIAAKDAKNKTVKAVKDQVSCALDGETVILHLGSGTYYGLNAVGSTIWNLIQEARTIAEIHDRLLQQYEADAGECERDLLNVLDDLSKASLVEIRDARTEEVS